MRTLSCTLTGAEANCTQCFVSTKPAKWPYYTTHSVISSRVTVGSGISCDVQMAHTYTSVGQTATLTIRARSLPQNGHYYCLADSRKYNFDLFLRNHSNDNTLGVTLATTTVGTQDNLMWWNITSPDGSRVKRYIVEFECRIRSITFVEKYMSVSASEGTGRVATSVSCFGGLGQLYRVKVWAVSGTSISQALVCLPDGQCREENGKYK